MVEQLAEALGIDVRRALADYRDVEGGGPGGKDGFGDNGDDFGGGPSEFPSGMGWEPALAKVLGSHPRNADANPQAKALVQAAAQGDTGEIDRLLASGPDVDAEAPVPLPGGQPMAGVGQLFPGGAPEIVMTPSLVSIANNRFGATERLLGGGAC